MWDSLNSGEYFLQISSLKVPVGVSILVYIKKAIMLEELREKSTVLLRVFCQQNDFQQRIFTGKYLHFTVKSV